MLVVNLFGSPGSGKSTGAAYIFSKLKLADVNCELVTEYVKGKVYEGSQEVFKNQTYVFGKQYFAQTRCQGKVDVIVVDSPLLLSCYYGDHHDERLNEAFHNYVKLIFDSFENFNILVKRAKKYNPSGRFQSEERSNEMADEMENMLKQYEVDYHTIKGNTEGYDSIVIEILNYLNNKN